MNYKKRGQVTIFIIIGIILLFSSALIFYIRDQIATIQSSQIEQITTDIPVSRDPVETYIRDCLESVAIEQIREVGAYGGYAEVDPADYNTANPSRSSVLKISPGSDVYVPYWYNMPSRDTCTTDCYVETTVPPLRKNEGQNSIEEAIQEKIIATLPICLDNLNVFRQEGYDFEISATPVVDVSVAREDIAIKMNYVIISKKDGTSTRYDEFLVRIPLNLDKIYELAVHVLKQSVEMQYVEGQAINMIESFGGMASDGIPPTYEMRFDSGDMVMWQKSEVKDRVMDILQNHIPMMQVIGTRNYYRHQLSDMMMQGITDKMIMYQNQSYPWYNVNFVYLRWWPIYFDISPSQGELIMPDSQIGGPLASLIPGFGMTEYKFKYDVSFPVLIQIEYPEALYGKGFTLNYVIEGNVRNNKPVNGSLSGLRGGPRDTLLCQRDLWQSGPNTLTVIDGSTDDPIEGAIMSFNFGNEGCPLGLTEQQIDGTINLQTMMPSGIGTMTAEHQDYGSKSVLQGIGAEPKEITITMYPKKEVTTSIKKIPYSKSVDVEEEGTLVNVIILWLFDGSSEGVEMESKDTLVLQYTQEGEDEPVEGVIFVGEDATELTMTLVPGNYTVQAQIINRRTYTIPPDERCYPSGFLGLGEDCDTIDEVNMEQMPYGNLLFEGTFAWEVTPEDLYSNDEVTFKVPFVAFYDIPQQWRVIEDLEKISDLEGFSESFRASLEPEWS